MCTASHWTNGQDLLGRGGEARTGTDDAGGVEPWARSRSAAVSRGLQRGDPALSGKARTDQEGSWWDYVSPGSKM